MFDFSLRGFSYYLDDTTHIPPPKKKHTHIFLLYSSGLTELDISYLVGVDDIDYAAECLPSLRSLNLDGTSADIAIERFPLLAATTASALIYSTRRGGDEPAQFNAM